MAWKVGKIHIIINTLPLAARKTNFSTFNDCSLAYKMIMADDIYM